MRAHAKGRASNVVWAAVLGLGMLLGSSSALDAQVPADGRWTPWVGCWEPVDASPELGMLCIRGSDDGEGVDLLTVVDGQISQTETLIADGMAREADQEGCTGEEWADFSPGGDRVYLRAEHVCGGATQRSSNGMFSMTTPSEWIQVETVDVAGRESSWVQRFQLAPPGQAEAVGLPELEAVRSMAVESARYAASAPITVDDVIEASSLLDEESLRVWVAERGDRLELEAEDLIRMSDAGVPESVIDMVVAVSFPDAFEIAQGYEEGSQYRGDPYYGSGYYDPWFSSRYNRYGLGYYGHRYGFGYYDSYRPTVVIVQPRDNSTLGRLIRGQGYTGGSSSSGSSRSVGSSGSAGSGAGASSSGGSSSRATGRKAKPKTGGGGGGGGGGLN